MTARRATRGRRRPAGASVRKRALTVQVPRRLHDGSAVPNMSGKLACEIPRNRMAKASASASWGYWPHVRQAALRTARNGPIQGRDHTVPLHALPPRPPGCQHHRGPARLRGQLIHSYMYMFCNKKYIYKYLFIYVYYLPPKWSIPKKKWRHVRRSKGTREA